MTRKKQTEPRALKRKSFRFCFRYPILENYVRNNSACMRSTIAKIAANSLLHHPSNES